MLELFNLYPAQILAIETPLDPVHIAGRHLRATMPERSRFPLPWIAVLVVIAVLYHSRRV